MRFLAAAILAGTLTALLPRAGAAQSDSTFLDGPCLDERVSYRDFRSRYLALGRDFREASQADDLPEAIRVQKEIVRLRCDNAWRWFRLAELYLRAERVDSAVVVVDHVDSWAANEIARIRDASGHSLAPLWSTEAFRTSDLARRMERRQEAHRRRLERFRARLDSLERRPPRRYVAEGVCPFECCVYRTWSVHDSTTLYAALGGDSVVATLMPEDTVEGLTGEVHLRPLAVAVVHEPRYGEALEAGDIVFLLDYVGEGFHHVWHEGRVLQAATVPHVRDYCPVPGPDCWGEHLAPERSDEEYVWWVKVRAPDGTVGWTPEPGAFGNMDACGM